MTRRHHQSPTSDNGSLKENKDINLTGCSAVKIKAEKVRQQHQASGRMGKGKKRATEEEEDEDENHDEQDDDAGGDEDDEEGGGSPKGRKRARVNMEGDGRPSQSQAEEVAVIVKTQPRDTDGFIPGQIVRMQLHNFLTYDFTEFACGPYLNMIIGPNGTGKSSIACAIALGLNWPPSILGRAENIQSFVKNDKETGYVEIEMKGPKGKPNLIIRRNINSASKTNSFTLNGKPATGKEVATKMAELNVQISNLCTFLPQDKVSSFAMMSPQQLLKETQRAAGDRNLTAWHETLIKSGSEHRTMLQAIKEEEDQLHQMQERNAAIEKEVERYNERKRIEEQIALFDILIPVARYEELFEKYGRLKLEQRRLHAKVQKLKQKNAPAHELLETLNKDLQQADKARERKKEAIKKRFDQMSSKWNQNTKLEADAESLNSQIEELEMTEQRRKQKIKKLEEDIARIDEELNREVEVERIEDIIEEARQNSREKQEVQERLREFEVQVERAVRDKHAAEHQFQELQHELQRLDTVDGRKMQNLFNWDKDVADVVVWLRQNQSRFKMGILEPAFLSLTVRDQRYADAVESCINSAQMKTFVAQCREDYDKFNDLVNDQNSVIGRPCRVPTWFRDNDIIDRVTVPPPMSVEEMRELRFDGYALDFVECPEGLQAFLKAELQMHRTAIALNPNVDVNRAMELVSRPTNGYIGGANFITGHTLHQVTRSKYGKHARSNATRNLGKARNLSAQNVDMERKLQLEANMREYQQKVTVFQEEADKIEAEARPFDEKLKMISRKKTELERRRDAVQKEKQRISTLTSRKGRLLEQLKSERKVPPPEKERQNIRKKMVKIAMQRMELAEEHVKLARAVIEEQVESTRIALEYLQIAANKVALEELCEKKAAKFNKALDEWGKADAEYRQVKDESKEALHYVHAVMDEAEPELAEIGRRIQASRKEYYRALKEAEANGTEPPSKENIDLRSYNELEVALEDQKAQLELVTKTNPGVVEQYEKRKREIEQLEAILDKKKRDAERVEKSINVAKSKWKPALEKLVNNIGEKFSAAFDRIGCAGEIRISENEDYDKWAIDILVKFRDDEKLQLLTGQRQSGGERSLTTILYLMSLTEEARTPFSLVDEINQGMDQRAERVVHDNMVDVTCKDNAGQYFLITPKLLPDLKYHERMRVLCVANGEWLPEENGVGNLKQMIEGYVSLKHGKAASSH